MNRLFILIICASFGLASQAVADSSSYYNEYYFDCSMLTSTAEGECPDKVRSKVDGKGSFRFGLWNNAAFDIDTVWLRARLDGQSNFVEIHKRSANITRSGQLLENSSSAVGVVFEFNEAFLQGKLGKELADIEGGFDFEMKIKSVGLGSGLEDKCHIAAVKWDSTNARWLWRKKTSDSSWHAIQSNSIFWYDVGGSVNSVKCGVKDVGGPLAN